MLSHRCSWLSVSPIAPLGRFKLRGLRALLGSRVGQILHLEILQEGATVLAIPILSFGGAKCQIALESIWSRPPERRRLAMRKKIWLPMHAIFQRNINLRV